MRDVGPFDDWNSQIDLVGRLDGTAPDASRTRTFHVAPRGNYDSYMSFDMESAPLQRLSYDGGEFLVAASNVKGRTRGLALWRGPHHEVATYVANAEALAVTPALDRLSGLRFHDEPDGLVVNSEVGETIRVKESFTFFPEVGTLDVYSPEVGLPLVPSWSGAKARLGEVWRSAFPEDPASTFFVVSSPSAVAVLTPRVHKREFQEKCAALLDGIASLAHTPKNG
ncbi:hypothetical protein ACIRN4_06995 [Pimelobacter simplex]|uniref:hypothetical protein n=1 Tax=Nocardioides simplex TaxID=2045 RepID=UPI0037F21EE8